MTENLGDFFTDDFCVSATYGAETAKVLFDTPDSFAAEGMVITAEYMITYRKGIFSGLKYGDTITVDGGSYTVNTVQAIDDGKLIQAALSSA